MQTPPAFDNLTDILIQRRDAAVTYRNTVAQANGATADELLYRAHCAKTKQFEQGYLAKKDDNDPLVYFPLIWTKATALAAHLYDIVTNIQQFPGSIEPTPVPELREEKVQELARRMYDQVVHGDEMVVGADATVEDIAARMKAIGLKELSVEALRCSRAHEKLLRDQFAEGGWANAALEVIEDMTYYPTAFMLLQFTKKNRLVWVNNKATVRPVLMPSFKRIPPNDVFPSPDSISTQQGTYVFYREIMTKPDFAALADIQSYDAAAIRSVLRDMRALPEANATEEPGAGDSLAKVNTHETVTEVMSPPDPAKTPSQLAAWHDDYTVTAWVMFGKVAGADLVGCNLDFTPDPDKYYEAEAMFVNRTRVRFVVFPVSKQGDPVRHRRLMGASYRPTGAFWGEGGEQILRSSQRKANAVYRDGIINGAFARAPISWYDINAIASTTPNPAVITPGKAYGIRRDPMFRNSSEQRPVGFIDVPDNVSTYRAELAAELQIADTVFGIPAFAHGQGDVGTLGRTFNGMALVYGAALKGVKLGYSQYVRNIFAVAVESLYNMNLMYSPDESIKGDTQIVVKGPEGIVEKELSQGMFVQDMQNILPLVEAGILPKDLAVEIAKDFARSRGYNVDAFAKSGAGMSPPVGATPGTPTPQPSPQNPVATQPVGAQNGA